MPRFETSRQVPHTAEHMFALVADVERYPEFVPLCEALTIQSRSHVGEESIITASMTVAYKMFRERFTSRVRLFPDELLIKVDYLDGPFRKMENLWRFQPAGQESCKVIFDIDYEFRSRILASLMGAVFDKAFRKFAEAFEARADQIYAPRGDGAAIIRGV